MSLFVTFRAYRVFLLWYNVHVTTRSLLIPINNEIERACWRNRAEPRQRNMEGDGNDPVRSGATSSSQTWRRRWENDHPWIRSLVFDEHQSTIWISEVEGNPSFEIKSSIIHMVQNNQFAWNPFEDLQHHINNFLQVCNTFNIPHLSKKAILSPPIPVLNPGQGAKLVEFTRAGVDYHLGGLVLKISSLILLKNIISLLTQCLTPF